MTNQPPAHVAIIMDGNGRWAKERGLPRRDGHAAGAESVREALKACINHSVRHLTLYAFSTENWNRPKTEVAALMTLLERFLKKELPTLMEQGIRLRTIGRTHMLPKKTQKTLQSVIDATADNQTLDLILALSYGSREELTDATQLIAQKVKSGELEPDQITNDTIQEHLYTHNLPDPDLLIRTSGELRLSNFLLWQLSYAEFYSTGTHWPDFRQDDFAKALEAYQNRHRRFGGL